MFKESYLGTRNFDFNIFTAWVPCLLILWTDKADSFAS